MTIDELADRVGMTVRNLREWRTLGLLPKAEMRGRVGYYDETVVERVTRVKQLHAEGFTLELIARMLDAGEAATRLAETLRAPVSHTGTDLAEQEAFALIHEHAQRMAADFERLWMEHVWDRSSSPGCRRASSQTSRPPPRESSR